MEEHMSINSRPLRARARLGDRIIADSTAIRLVEQPDGPAALWFPEGDTQLTGFIDHGTAWSAGDGDLAGWVRFNDTTVQVELVDDMGSDDPRDSTAKQFPNWGDLDDLLALLTVQRVDDGRYIGAARVDLTNAKIERVIVKCERFAAQQTVGVVGQK